MRSSAARMSEGACDVGSEDAASQIELIADNRSRYLKIGKVSMLNMFFPYAEERALITLALQTSHASERRATLQLLERGVRRRLSATGYFQ